MTFVFSQCTSNSNCTPHSLLIGSQERAQRSATKNSEVNNTQSEWLLSNGAKTKAPFEYLCCSQWSEINLCNCNCRERDCVCDWLKLKLTGGQMMMIIRLKNNWTEKQCALLHHPQVIARKWHRKDDKQIKKYNIPGVMTINYDEGDGDGGESDDKVMMIQWGWTKTIFFFWRLVRAEKTHRSKVRVQEWKKKQKHSKLMNSFQWNG